MQSAADGTTFNGSCRPGRRIPARPAELRASLHVRRSRERLDVLQAAAGSGILTQDQAEVRMQAPAGRWNGLSPHLRSCAEVGDTPAR
jgi:hypothetical protein